MTTKIKALTVVLEADTREDDVESLVQAVTLLRGVASVTTEPVDMGDYSARQRLAYEWRNTMLEVFVALCNGRKVTVEKP